MAQSEQEIEVKFLVRNLGAIASRLQELGARLAHERVLEVNLRFDTPDSHLSRERQVLRLRQDTQAWLTFKGPSDPGESVNVRKEIEFQVSDFAAARHLLEALGYVVVVSYEKYRTTYALGERMVTLDEMPFGNFIEIEGPDAGSLEEAAAALRLDWQARSTASYLELFYQLRAERRLAAHNLTFAELQAVKATPPDLGLRYADA